MEYETGNRYGRTTIAINEILVIDHSLKFPIKPPLLRHAQTITNWDAPLEKDLGSPDPCWRAWGGNIFIILEFYYNKRSEKS